MPYIQNDLPFFFDISPGKSSICDQKTCPGQMIIIRNRTGQHNMIRFQSIMRKLLKNCFPVSFVDRQNNMKISVIRPGQFLKNRQNVAFKCKATSGYKKNLSGINRSFFIKGIIKRIPCTTFQFFDDLFCKCHTSSFLYNKLL